MLGMIRQLINIKLNLVLVGMVRWQIKQILIVGIFQDGQILT